MEAIKNRYEFVFLFDVKDGNPMVIQISTTCLVQTKRLIRG